MCRLRFIHEKPTPTLHIDPAALSVTVQDPEAHSESARSFPSSRRYQSHFTHIFGEYPVFRLVGMGSCVKLSELILS